MIPKTIKRKGKYKKLIINYQLIGRFSDLATSHPNFVNLVSSKKYSPNKLPFSLLTFNGVVKKKKTRRRRRKKEGEIIIANMLFVSV